MGRIKLHELDLMRAVAIAAVVLLHGTSEGSSIEALGGAHILLLAINKLCAFAVPVFIFVSGLVLFYGAEAEWDAARTVGFYKRRARSVLVPYLLWTVIYYLFNQWLAHGRDMQLDPAYFAKLLVTGNASYHLYFLVIIMQFYAVFPLLLRFVQRYDCSGWLLLAGGVTVQLGFYAFSQLVHPVPFMYLWGFGYAALFALGGWFGLAYAARGKAAEGWTRWLAAAALLIGFSYAGLFIMADKGMAISDMWFELAYNALAAAAAAALVGWSRRLLTTEVGSGTHRTLWTVGLVTLGSESFGVYLVHPLFLSTWRQAAPFINNGWLYEAVNTIGLVLVLALSWGVAYAYRRKEIIRPSVRI